MADLSKAAQKALAYWPWIEQAARDGISTADLWATLRDVANDLGLASPGVSAAGVATLRGYAGRIQRSGQELAKADPTDRLDGYTIATAPWSRSEPERDGFGMYQVRYQHTYSLNGEDQTEWRTSMFRGGLPTTVGELQDGVDEDAEAMADKYGVDHIGVSNLQLMAV